MTRTTVISFLALTFGIGGALAAGVGLQDDADAYTVSAASVGKNGAEHNAAYLFQRADINDDGALDADEYASLAIVTAELSRLNGFVAVETEGGLVTAALPADYDAGLSRTARAEISALSRQEFYRAVGDDDLLDAAEFLDLENARFERADRNGDQKLTRNELVAFAADTARLKRNAA